MMVPSNRSVCLQMDLQTRHQVAQASGVARILLKGVLKGNGQLAGHRGWGREGDVPPPAEGGSF